MVALKGESIVSPGLSQSVEAAKAEANTYATCRYEIEVGVAGGDVAAGCLRAIDG
jgi:hypothetical protein